MNSLPHSSRDWRIPVAWLTLCVVWSSTWLVIKLGLRDLPPVSFVALRFLIAILVLFVISVGRARLLPHNRADCLVLAGTGLLMFALNYALLFWAELHVSSGLAAVIQASIPIFGMVFAHWMLPEEPLRWQRLAGALVAILGVAFICARLLSFNGWLAFLGGVGVTIGAASAAFSNVVLKAKKIQLAPSMLAAWQMIFGIVPLVLLGLALDGNPLRFHWTGSAILCLLYLAVIGSSFTFLLLYWLMPRMSVTNLQTIALITPPGSDRARLGLWRRKAFGLVAARRGSGSPRRLDDFSPHRRAATSRRCEPRLIRDNRRDSGADARPSLRFRRPCWRGETLGLSAFRNRRRSRGDVFAQVARQFGNVDAAIVFHAGKGEGAVTFGGEKFEAALAHPGVDERVRARVALIAIR